MRCVQVFVITALILVHSASAQEGNWRLVWQDDFNGNQLDFNQWEIEINAFGGGNQELQIYTDRKENVRVEGGNLILEAHRGRRVSQEPSVIILRVAFAPNAAEIGLIAV